MIDILLSTYNGEKYLKQQIESITSQTYSNWRLLIRDDGSTDSTIEIIEKYVHRYPNKIEFIIDDNGNVGSTRSFELLLNHSSSEYIMFCDQDDVWFNDKIMVSYNKIKDLEEIHPDSPLLIFTDLTVVNESLKVICESFFKYQKLFPDICENHYHTLALNVAPGCTMIFNKLSKKHILPFKDIIHDFWVINIIAYYGYVDYIDYPTMYYRQHQANCVGASEVDKIYLIKRISNPLHQIKLLNTVVKKFPFKTNLSKFWYFKILFFVKRLMKMI